MKEIKETVAVNI